jgi:hypothetical protein
MGTTPPAQPAKPAKPAAPTVTLRQVLEDYPLYRAWRGEWRVPGSISRDCTECGKETTWKYGGNLANSPGGSLKLPYYSCVDCGKDSVYFLIVVLNNGRLMKAGQFPMPSVRVPKNIEKRLGASADFYKKALTSRNEGYGLGAVAYFRRVVEDKTNELVDVVADAAEAYGVPAADVEKIRAAKNEKTYEDKLKVAAHAVPEVLKPDGANPFQAMYDILSGGIHAQSEEECLQIADDVREIFDYLFDRLRAEIAERTAFVSKVKAMAGKRGPRVSV